MRNCLIVLQPRRIQICLQSIRALPIDQVWFEAFTERELEGPLNRFIRDTDYDNYLIVSDDVVASAAALERVVELLLCHEVATGYCRLSQDVPWVNVVRSPLRFANGVVPTMDDYDFYHIDEVRQFSEPTFVSWFAGWALTGMRRRLWLEFPFEVNPATGMQTDFQTSWRLRRPIAVHKNAYIEHLKAELMGYCASELVVGRLPPRIVFRKHR